MDQLEKTISESHLWDNHDFAKKTLQNKDNISKKLNRLLSLESNFTDYKELYELSKGDSDPDSLIEIEKQFKIILKDSVLFKIEALFSGDADSNNCFLEIHPGAGGTESHDWAEMLLRMYIRFADLRGFKTEILDEQKGDEVGIKSVTIKISALNAYGFLKNESGVHRLVRISPFNSNGKRMTSFASVWVYPEIDEEIKIEIADKDLRIDTYRSSGAGGQHVNKTDSAIRITHLPTNIVVQCQNSRSQHKNREEAFKMLKSRLYELEIRKKQQDEEKQNSAKTDIGWGNQIRSYILQPYQMVKDLRSNYETSNIQAVLDGDIDEIINSVLIIN